MASWEAFPVVKDTSNPSDSWDSFPKVEEEPMIDVSDTLKAAGQAIGGITTTAPHAFRQLYSGLDNPWQRSEGYKASQAGLDRYQQELEAANQAAVESGDISTSSRGMRQAGQSLGFSAGAMGAGLVGSSATGLAGRGIGTAIAGPAGAATGEVIGRGVGALGAGYGAAYRMAGAQFLDDASKEIDAKFMEKLGRLPNEQEQKEAYDELLPLAQAFGHAEAGPEAIGNLAMAKAGKFILGLGINKVKGLAAGALSKVGAGAGGLATELGGETVTQVEQNRLEEQKNALLSGQAPPEQGPRTLGEYQKALGEVAPATLATMGLIGSVPTAYKAAELAVKAYKQPANAAAAELLHAASVSSDDTELTNKATEEQIQASVDATVVNGLGEDLSRFQPPDPQVANDFEEQLRANEDENLFGLGLEAEQDKLRQQQAYAEAQQRQAQFEGLSQNEPAITAPVGGAIPAVGQEEAAAIQPEQQLPDGLGVFEAPQLAANEPTPSESLVGESEGVLRNRAQIANAAALNNGQIPATPIPSVFQPVQPTVAEQPISPQGAAPTGIATQTGQPMSGDSGKAVEMTPMPGVLPGGENAVPMAPAEPFKQAVTILRDNVGGGMSLVDMQRVHAAVAEGYSPEVAATFAIQEKQAHQKARKVVTESLTSGEIESGKPAQDLYEQVYQQFAPQPLSPAAQKEPPLTPSGQVANEGGGPVTSNETEDGFQVQPPVETKETPDAEVSSGKGASLFSQKEDVKPLPKEIKAIHFSRSSLSLSEKETGSSVGEGSDSVFGFGLYAMEPQDQKGWESMDRLVLGKNRNELTINAKNPLIVSPETVVELMQRASKDGVTFNNPWGFHSWLREQAENGKNDAVIVRGFDLSGDKSKVINDKIRDRINELWKPIFPKGKTDGKFINGDKLNAAVEKATNEITGLNPQELEITSSMQNQIFIPPNKVGIVAAEAGETTSSDIESKALEILIAERPKLSERITNKAKAYFQSRDENDLKDLSSGFKGSIKKALQDADPNELHAVLVSDREQVEKLKQQAAEDRKADEARAKLQAKLTESRRGAYDSIVGTPTGVEMNAVSEADGQESLALVNNSGDVPGVLNAFVGTSSQFLANPENETNFPDLWKILSAGRVDEGNFAYGRAFVFTDGIGVNASDRRNAERLGVTPSVAAVRRVLIHEGLVHRGIYGLPARLQMQILQWVRQNTTPEQLDNLARDYPQYENWRNNPQQMLGLCEEYLAKTVEKITKFPKDGPLSKLFNILKDIWRWITGETGEPTVQNLRDVIKLLKAGVVAADARLANGGKVDIKASNTSSKSALPSSNEYIKNTSIGGVEGTEVLDQYRRYANDYLNWRAKGTELYFHVSPLYVGDAGGRMEAASYPLQTRIGQDNRVTIDIGNPIPSGFKGDQATAKKRIADAVDEEIIHAADLLALKAKWESEGSSGKLGDFVLSQTQKTTDDILQSYTNMSPSDKAVIDSTIEASFSLYFGQSMGVKLPEFIAALRNNGRSDIEMSMLAELTRQVIQLRQTGGITETGWRSIAKPLIEWMQKMVDALRVGAQKIRDGQFGKLLKARVDEAESQLQALMSGSTIKSSRPSFANPINAELARAAERFRQMNERQAVETPEGLKELFNPNAQGSGTTNKLFEKVATPQQVRGEIRAAYDRAIVGTGSIQTSLQQVFDEAKKAVPTLTEKQFGEQLQALYEDGSAFFVPADRSDTMLAAGEKWGVYDASGMPASYVGIMPLEIRASRVNGETEAKHRKLVQEKKVNGPQVNYGGRPIQDEKGNILDPTYQTLEGYEKHASVVNEIVDDLIKSLPSPTDLPSTLNSDEYLSSIGAIRNIDLQQSFFFEGERALRELADKSKDPEESHALIRASKEAGVYARQLRSGAGRANGRVGQQYKDPRYAGQILVDGLENAKAIEQDEAIAGKFTDDVDEQVSSINSDANQGANTAMEGDLEATLENAQFEEGKKSLSEKARSLLAKIHAWIADLGAVRAALATKRGNIKASNAAERQSKYAKMTIEQLEAEESNLSKKVEAALEDLADELFKTSSKKKTGKKLTKQAAKKTAEKLARPTKKEQLLKGGKMTQLQNLLNKSREGWTWPQIFALPEAGQVRRRADMLQKVKDNEAFADLTDEEKAQLVDLLDQAWYDRKATYFGQLLKRMGAKLPFASNKSVSLAVIQSVDKLLKHFNDGTFDKDAFREVLAEKFGIKPLDQENLAKAKKLAQEMQSPDISSPQWVRKADELTRLVSSGQKLSLARVLSDWWITAVLSGPRTLFAIATAFTNGLGRIIADGGTRLVMTGDVKSVASALKRYFEIWPTAFKEMGYYVITGDKSILENSKEQLSKYMAEGLEGSNPITTSYQLLHWDKDKRPDAAAWEKTQGKIMRAMGRFMTVIERVLGGLDHFNAATTKYGYLPLAIAQNQQIYKDARLPTEAEMSLFRNQAKAELFDGREPQTLAEKTVLDSWTRQISDKHYKEFQDVIDGANYAAQLAAMTTNPEGFAGGAYRLVLSAASKGRLAADKLAREAELLKQNPNASKYDIWLATTSAASAQLAAYSAQNLLGVRFIRFVSNKFNDALTYIPIAGYLLRAGEKTNRNKTKTAIIHSNQAIGMFLGMVGWAAVKAIADEPDDEKRGWSIDGPWQNLSPEQKSQLMSSGRKANSITIGGRVLSYQGWPISAILSAIGTLTDMVKYQRDKWDEKDYGDRFFAATYVAVTSVADTAALSQLSEILGKSVNSSDPIETGVKRFAKYGSNFAGGFVPRLFKDMDSWFSEGINKYDGVYENFAKEIPWYRRNVGAPRLDIFGEQVKVSRAPWSREFPRQPTDPAYALLGKLNQRDLWLAPSDPSLRTVGMGNRRRHLNPDEQNRYMQEVSKGYKDLVMRYGQKLLTMPGDRASDFLAKKSKEVRDRAEKKSVRKVD